MKRIATFLLFLLLANFSRQAVADDGWVGTWATAVEPTTAKADGVIDFDALARDPQQPSQLLEAYSDDWLHLNPTGYENTGRLAAEVLTDILY